jgi:quinol monooxygenase YgiN
MPEDEAPFALVVRFTVRPGSEKAFDRLREETASGVREREPETLIYACHVVQENPRQRIFYELYRNRAAFDRHESQQHVRRFLVESATMLESAEVDFLSLQDGKTPPGFQLDAIVAGAQQRIRQMQERGGILRAIIAALDDMAAVTALVENTESLEAAQASVMELLDIDHGQARAVLDLQLRALSPQRRQQIVADYGLIVAELEDLESLLASPDRLRALVGTERAAYLARHDERRWARTDDDDWPGPALGGAAGTGP